MVKSENYDNDADDDDGDDDKDIGEAGD